LEIIKNLEKTYQIKGMHCPSCVGRVKRLIEVWEGVTAVKVSLQPALVLIESQDEVDMEALNEALSEIGEYHLTPFHL
jgi:P-type Cu+ transporter